MREPLTFNQEVTNAASISVFGFIFVILHQWHLPCRSSAEERFAFEGRDVSGRGVRVVCDFMELIVPKGQGHNMWNGFFECQKLVDFVIANAKESLNDNGS